MTVHAQPDYRIKATTPAPAGYPAEPSPDAFSERPFLPDYGSRRKTFLDHILRNPAPENTKAGWYELARLAAGGKPHEGVLLASLDFIDARRDCADFALHGILRLLYQFTPYGGGQGMRIGQPLPTSLVSRMRKTVLDFKYFPDEPGVDSLCTWTENHYILFTSAAYLSGQMFPREVFSNSGQTGRQKVELNRPRILRWLELRFRSGFSEWLSHVYYDEDLAALLALYDFAADGEIRDRAEMALDLLLLDMALNSFKGVFGSTHGRAYENTKKWASNEGTSDTSKLLFGAGIFSGFDNMSAVAFALSNYRVPPAVEAVAHYTGTLENRQRIGIRLAEMEKWGIRPDNFEDGMQYLTLEAYLHPRTIANTLRMFDICNWWENSFLSDFKPYRGLLKALGKIGGLPLLAHYLERDVCRNTREEVNIYTYRTPDYMLSTAQDYRKGYGGDQQSIWQATLGADAVCFTTHPAKIEGVTPNYWTGSGLLPRAAQYRNVAIVVYKIERIPALYMPIRHFYTHAWLPRDKFDEMVEKAGWVFARKGAGYLALRSQNPYFWREKAQQGKPAGKNLSARDALMYPRPEDEGREILADGARNIWVCQLGREADDGPFSAFIDKISAAELVFKGLDVRFRSPGNGLISFGWEGPLTVDGVEIALKGYRRYDNPFLQADFNSDEICITSGDHKLVHNWKTSERSDQ
ncbi:MAG: hypothetical protein WC169_00080 [Dehalococcoidia bacterium]|jgi:hypothetical protein